MTTTLSTMTQEEKDRNWWSNFKANRTLNITPLQRERIAGINTRLFGVNFSESVHKSQNGAILKMIEKIDNYYK